MYCCCTVLTVSSWALPTGMLSPHDVCAFIYTTVVSSCTSGFMHIDLLRRRAEKIPFGDRSDNFLDGEFRLIPDVNFTCSGTITSLLIGGYI